MRSLALGEKDFCSSLSLSERGWGEGRSYAAKPLTLTLSRRERELRINLRAGHGTRAGFFSVFRNSSPRGAGRLTTIVFPTGAGMGGRSAPGKALKAIAKCESPANTLEKVADE